MPKYATVAQVRLSDDALFSSDMTDLILARTIARAETDVDSFMGFPMQTGGFEPHVTWVEFPWDPVRRRVRFPNAPVPVRRALRYQIQVANMSNTGAPFVAIINDADVAYNLFDYYVEIVPLTSITYSLAPVLTMLGLDPPIVQLDCEVGFYLPFYGDTLSNTYAMNGSVSSGDLKNYTAARGFWATTYTQALSIQPQTLPPVPPVIYKNGIPQVAASLSSALSAGTAYTALPVVALPQAIAQGSSLIVNDGSGQTALSVTVASPGAAIGATTLPISNFTPAVSYPAGTVFAQGYSANYTEGRVTFASPLLSTDVVSADYTAQIPDQVTAATIAQTSYILGQRALNKQGLAGLESIQMGKRKVDRGRRYIAGTTYEFLCQEALLCLSNYSSIAVA